MSNIDENEDNWQWIRTSILMPDGTWFVEDKTNSFASIELKHEKKHWHERHSYLYFTHNGANQSCIAEISVEKREWVHKITADRKVLQDICVAFNGELGNEAGSWKGGVIGCNYEMKPGETPLETLRRMEKERVFS